MEIPEGVEVYSFDFDARSIRLKFTNFEVWEFTVDTVGAVVVEQLKKRAMHGHGLNTYLRSLKVYSTKGLRHWVEWPGTSSGN